MILTVQNYYEPIKGQGICQIYRKKIWPVDSAGLRRKRTRRVGHVNFRRRCSSLYEKRVIFLAQKVMKIIL